MLKKIFIILAVASVVYSGLLLYLTSQTIHSGIDKPALIESYYSYQSLITLSNFGIYFILLLFSCIIFYKNKATLYIYISTLIFIGYTLANNWFIMKPFYSIKDTIGPSSGEYQMNIIITAFYCIASVAISAITYITIRNIKFRKI